MSRILCAVVSSLSDTMLYLLGQATSKLVVNQFSSDIEIVNCHISSRV